MLGLAAVAAIAAMAFLGTAGASASSLYIALCTVDQLECPTANIIKHIHETDSAALLLNDITGYIVCTGLFLGDVLTANGLGHLTLTISGKFTYSGCETKGGAECEAKELGGPVNITVHKTADELAAVTGEGEVLVDCSTTPHCVYNGKGLKGEALGALHFKPNGTVHTNEAVVNKVSGFFCPTTSKLDVLYVPLAVTYIKS
jgi:hypothetical protein